MVQWWLSRKTRNFCLWLWAILPIRDWRCQDIDQVLLHEIIFFCVFSSSEVLAKITSIRSKLPTAACWSREKKERKLWSQLTLLRKRLLYQTSQTNHSQCSSFVEALNLIVEWFDHWVTCAVKAKEKLAIVLFCGFWFPCFNASWYDLWCYVAWRRLKFR